MCIRDSSRSQKVKTIPKDGVASIVLTAVSVSTCSIGKSLAESTRMAGPPSLAEPSVVHRKELEVTGLPFEVPSPKDLHQPRHLQTLPRRRNSQLHRHLYKWTGDHNAPPVLRGEQSSVITEITDQKSKPKPEPNRTALVRFSFGFVFQKPNLTEPNRISYPIYHPTHFNLVNHIVHNKN